MRQVGSRPDPAPSRWSYRYQRLMLTPFFRKVLRVGIPFCLAFGTATAYLSDEVRRERLVLAYTDIRHRIETRPEFMVNLLAIEGASAGVQEEIREIFPIEFPISSFDLELDHIRNLIKDLPPVADVSVHIRQGGMLIAKVVEREPVALWRSRDGLAMVDVDGVRVAELDSRTDRPDLPVVAGLGADKAIPDALNILTAAAPLVGRVRGLVRVGERRWDLVLDRDQRILLPEHNPVRAVERVIVLGEVQDMLERDLVAVDMRMAMRPTIRMNERAVEEWWRVRKISADISAGGGN
ncbi:cell division protein FtsQ/DivIB [Roseovarius aestuarii]|uniref:Cell division protein FtsQ n=1 Tax=Roseovarius aestuarii TaxID=475083 RepID=A0A1X7BLH6_9RHOB|nr:cell division protein FtsQ/DivIB [Roseovarius aestuarii]SMC10404.1 cell division protein FtsQ [Roseovarius aestuarii]